MRRSRYLLVFLALFMTLSACAPAEEITENNDDTAVEEATDIEEGKVLVAYFSQTGNTEKVALKIAELSGADVYEILPADPYEDEDLVYYDEECRSFAEQKDVSARPAIGSETIDLSKYTVIYVGYPIWYAQEPRILDTFVETYDFTGKTVIPFCTSDNSPIGNSGKSLEADAGSGNWLEGERFGADFKDDEVSAFVETTLKQ